MLNALKRSDTLRVALLHLAPLPGNLAANRQAIEGGVERAAAAGADWIITPELAVSGYTFVQHAGADWIEQQPDAWAESLIQLVRRLHVTLFLGTPERDTHTGKLHNSVLVIGSDGSVLGRYRKTHVVPIPAEAWATRGETLEPILVDGIRIGVLICADSYTPHLPAQLLANGAQLLVAPVAWARGEHGPEGIWEARSGETGMTILICNRTGEEPGISFMQADSVVARGGERVLEFCSPLPTLLLVDLDRATFEPISAQFDISPLPVAPPAEPPV